MHTIFFGFLVMALFLMESGCSYKEKAVPVCDLPLKVYFSQNIFPIISQNCVLRACHTTGFVYGDFSSWYGIEQYAKDGSLKAMVEGNKMPLSTTHKAKFISDCEKKQIYKWLQDGFLND